MTPSPTQPPAKTTALAVRELGVTVDGKHLLADIQFDVTAKTVMGIIGPSGAGKTTLLKSLNRLLDLTPQFRVSGDVLLHDQSIYASDVDADALRARIGILFQQPVVFPKSILDNVLFGVRHLGRIPRADWPETAERVLREVSLWDEVKDRLRDSALRLSVGQQQRLCLARTLATRPEVILMDEPTSALDPKATEAIENLVQQLKVQQAIVLVTHNLAQARRVCDELVCLAPVEGTGKIFASGSPEKVLEQAKELYAA